jgi:arylsulfatase A-like enzyme
MERLLTDEADRPGHGQYVYAHLILPHYPYVWDGECRLNKRTGFIDQTSCATNLIKDFVGKLKQLARYDDSLIILQSDHGTSGVDAEPFFPLPRLEAGQRASEEFSKRLHALLLIKPPDAGAVPLRVSEDISQLADIPATVYDLLDAVPPPTDGHSVFELKAVGDREISVFSGINSNFGQSLDTLFRTAHASVGHLSYNPQRGWTLHPEIAATHEGW